MTELERMRKAIEIEMEWWRQNRKAEFMAALDDKDYYAKPWNRGFSSGLGLAIKRMQFILDNYGEK